jgi:hypothetical protein
LWLAQVARQAGLQVREAAGWQTRGSETFEPRGVVAHHTATPASWSSQQLTNLLVNGRSDLPGPLCQLQLDRDGTVVVIAAGRANHAGSGGWNGLSGNVSVLGIEAAHSGTSAEPWSRIQLEAYDRLSAALLTRLGQPASALCGHKEWAPSRKVDPVSLDMAAMRRRVARLMEGDELTPDEKAQLAQVAADVAVIKAALGGRKVGDDLRRLRISLRPIGRALGVPVASSPDDGTTVIS